MEDARESCGVGRGMLSTIRPPRLEDAGLEDCALPPEAIKEAFFKAANSIRSRATSLLSTDDDDDDDECVKNPGPSNGDLSDLLIGIQDPNSGTTGPCSGEIGGGGGLPEMQGDKVVVAGITEEEEGSDKLVGGEVPEAVAEKEGKACVEGLQGLKISQEELERDEEDKEEELIPILA